MEYLACGSSMLTSRLQSRVPSARKPRAVALPGFAVRYREVGSDGSAKCDLVREAGSTAYGVVFTIDPADKNGLDRAEGLGCGYREEPIAVEIRGQEVGVFVYVADPDWINEALRPFRSYRNLVVAGAREHRLPDAYWHRDEAVASRRGDPEEIQRRGLARREPEAGEDS